MKKLILTELLLLFLATTFMTDSPPPGWYQQTLPVSKLINDIFFIDSLNGWAVTTGGSSSTDTAYILYTTNAGNNWLIQKTGVEQLDAVQFLDNNNGYAVGKLYTSIYLSIYKTTNSGVNWIGLNNISGIGPTDLYFTNKDTGWISVSEASTGGLYKTTNGGINWTQQLSGSFRPTKLFFLNKDTGWVACQNVNLYRTTNGGSVWTQIFTSAFTIEAIFFLTPLKGWMRGGPDLNGNGASYTTNGGFNWTNCQGYTTTAVGYDIKFVNDSVGFSGGAFSQIPKSTDGGITWGYQNSPISSQRSTAFFRGDTLKGWESGNGVVHTTDGGGPLFLGVQQISNEIPSLYRLYQNYPNPFNPVTKIKYEIAKSSEVVLKIYNIQGKEVRTLVNKKHTAGTYETEFDARLQNGQGSSFSSGVYLYSLMVDGKLIETRKMILIK